MEDIDLNRWNRVHAVFDRALDLPAEARLAYLQKTCDLDETLRQEVEELLRAASPADNFLETPLSDLIQAILDETEPAEAAENAIGCRIGPYRLLEHIGSGGMGAVYRAERDDGQFQKRVAVKLIRPGVSRADALERFRSERQILADLEHAAIARLLDGGVAEVEAGAPERPYFIMEYVDGLPIDVYCDRHRLPVAKRLALFRDVCEAVQFAHQNLVVHRDLKPSNILVTKEGQVKLLDFGIAQVVNAESSGDGAARATPAPARMMTPEYASPEQVRGEKITTSADVYVLGVLLYELLTGHRPYQFKNYRRREVERIVLKEHPIRPSEKVKTSKERIGRTGDAEQRTPRSVSEARSTRPRRLARRLHGDLDCIVLKALRKAPEQRYVSVEQLSEDVRRHLEGMPVQARQGGSVYRTGKFVGRHRAGVAATMLVVLSLAFGMGYALKQERVAVAERDRAEQAALDAQREARKADRIMAFIISGFRNATANGQEGHLIDARDLLRQGVERAEVELQDEPELQAEMLEVLGRMYRGLLLYEEAALLWERTLVQRERLYGPDDPRIGDGLYELARLRQRAGSYDAAEALFRKALDLRQRVRGAGPHPDITQSLNGLAGVLLRQGRHAEAEPLFREALRQRQQLYGAEDPRVAAYWVNLGGLLHVRGAYGEAKAAFQEALAIYRQSPSKRDPILSVQVHLANVQRDLGAYTEAETVLRQAVRLLKAWYGEQDTRVTITQHDLAELLHRKGAYAEAEVLFREVLAIRRDAHGGLHAGAALTATRLADVLAKTGAFMEADSLYQAALKETEAALSKEHVRASYPLSGLGQLRLQQGRLTEAERHLREALRLRQEKFPEGHPQTAMAKVLLGRCLVTRGRGEEAVSLFAEGYTTLEGRLGDEHPETQQARQWIEEAREFENALIEEPGQIPVPAAIRNE